MNKTRLEAFSDGVIAIILTIMVLELKVPKDPTLSGLAELWPVWIAYALSYAIVFFAWINHQDILANITHVNRPILATNALLLFCVSLIPFATAFAGENHWSLPLPVIVYGLVMFAVSLAFSYLRLTAADHANTPEIKIHNRREARRSLSLAFMFIAGATLGGFYPRFGLAVFVAIPLILQLSRRDRKPTDRL